MKYEKVNNSCNCPNCSEKNPIYAEVCSNCGAFIRDRINTIDIWKTIWSLFVEPNRTIRDIIFTRKKNGIWAILPIFTWALFSWISIFFNFINYQTELTDNYLKFYGSVLGIMLFSILIWAIASKHLLLKFNYYTRIKDNLALIIYSFTPWILSFFLLLLVKLGLFGEFWFTFNPLPWNIKPFPAYFILSFEGLFLLWSMVLFFRSQLFLLKSKLWAVLINLFFYLIIVFSIAVFF